MPDTVDIVFRTVAVSSALLLAALLFAAHFLAGERRRPALLPGACLSLAVGAFFLTSGPDGGAALGAWDYPLTALCVTKAAWFWLLSRALFNDDARLRGRHVAIVLAVAAVGTWQQEVFLASYRAGSAATLEIVVGLGFDGVLLLFVLAGLYAAWRDLSVDLVEQRRRLRVAFVVAAGAYLTMTLTSIACLAAAWLLVQFRSDSWLDPARTPAAVALNRTETALLRDLERALQADRIYLQEGLTIGALAERLGSSERVLRQVINRGLGHRNFNDFLHAWRIREACEELARPEQARMPVLSIAMKVGYGSVGAFNRAFKARIGMTPTDYRRRTVNGASHAR